MFSKNFNDRVSSVFSKGVQFVRNLPNNINTGLSYITKAQKFLNDAESVKNKASNVYNVAKSSGIVSKNIQDKLVKADSVVNQGLAKSREALDIGERIGKTALQQF